MNTLNRINNHSRHQSGAALVVSLILLALLTVLAVSASQTTRMQERMAGNSRDADIAFQAAESGARNAEGYVEALTKEPIALSTAPSRVFQTGSLPLDLSNQTEDWWTNSSTGHGWEYGVANTQEITTAAADPRFVIEEAGYVPDDITEGSPPSGKTFYRTTTRAKGATGNAIAVVQTTYPKRF